VISSLRIEARRSSGASVRPWAVLALSAAVLAATPGCAAARPAAHGGNEPETMTAWREAIESARRAGTLDEIGARIEKRARDGPPDATASYALGMFRSAQHREDEAAVAFSRAATLRRDDPEIESRWGTALLRAGHPAEARWLLSRAVERAPAEASHRVALAACLSALGERGTAMETLREVPRLSPSAADADRAVRLARTLTDPFRELALGERTAIEGALRDLEGNVPGQALDELDLLLARFPALAAVRLLAALAAERMGDSGRAAAELRKAAVLAPDLPQPHAYLARLSARDRPELAAEEFAEALKRNPLDPGVLRALGELELDRLGQPARAADSLERAAGLLPDDARLQTLAARAELTAGAFGAGRERLARAIRRRRGDQRALLQLGAAAYDERGRAPDDGARAILTQCIDGVVEAVQEIDPENETARGLKRAAHGG
jgi:tetratricopeptide (TPR) repeat protein